MDKDTLLHTQPARNSINFSAGKRAFGEIKCSDGGGGGAGGENTGKRRFVSCSTLVMI